MAERIAAKREAERKEMIEVEKLQVKIAGAEREWHYAVGEAESTDLTTSTVDGYAKAIEWARQSAHSNVNASTETKEDEFDQRVDPEIYENPDTVAAPRNTFRVRRTQRARGRTRGAG